jgi:AraC-like DNA-binding protein
MMDGRGPDDGVDHTSRLLLAARGRARIDSLVERSGLSARHFQRRFTARVGLSPKLYARTIRFDAALIAHRDAPARPWTEIVHEAGYCDQAHFVRECHALVGLAPSRFIGDWENIFLFRRCVAEKYKRSSARQIHCCWHPTRRQTDNDNDPAFPSDWNWRDSRDGRRRLESRASPKN